MTPVWSGAEPQLTSRAPGEPDVIKTTTEFRIGQRVQYRERGAFFVGAMGTVRDIDTARPRSGVLVEWDNRRPGEPFYWMAFDNLDPRDNP